jgi:8-oxo-dGTP diphosphatase
MVRNTMGTAPCHGYCPACGSHLPRLPPTECLVCGTYHWNNPIPSACALVMAGGRLLLVERTAEPWAGYWDSPGGFCEPGEHPAHTAVRETLEEARLRIRVTGYLGIWSAPYPPAWQSGPLRSTHAAYYHAVPLEGIERATPGSEASNLGWFEPDSLPREIAYPEEQRPALSAWRDAVAAGDVTTSLRDVPVQQRR